MIRSMTGYGRAAFDVEGARFDVELRTVNHRYLDVRVRLPRPLASLEPQARTRAQSHFDRGKVDISVQLPGGSGLQPRLELDLDAAARYVEAASALHERHGLAGELSAASLLALPGVARFEEPELPEEPLRAALLAALDEAATAALAMREQEGAALERDLRGRLDTVAALGEGLAARSSEVQEAVRERLRKRLAQLRDDAGPLDELRLHQEVVLAADRLDVTEEIVRLRSHVEQFGAILDAAEPGKPVGRRLDFLIQEFGREANTTGSKAGDAAAAHLVVELKTELERMREQVQNVE